MKLLTFFIIVLFSTNYSANNCKNCYVPNEKTALLIAEAIFKEFYPKSAESCKPYFISLKDSVWIVKGSLNPKVKGGVPLIEISMKDGKILHLEHGK